jgi:hypothetical protein
MHYLQNKQKLTWDALIRNDIWLSSSLRVGRPRVGESLGFRRRPGFRGGEHTQSIHVGLTCLSMCDGGLGDAIARSPV